MEKKNFEAYDQAKLASVAKHIFNRNTQAIGAWENQPEDEQYSYLTIAACALDGIEEYEKLNRH